MTIAEDKFNQAVGLFFSIIVAGNIKINCTDIFLILNQLLDIDQRVIELQ